MASEILQNAAEKLQELKDWIRSSTVEKSIRIEDDDYQFDLGDFGYQSASVTVENDYYNIDVEEIFEDSPVSTDDLEVIIDELEAFRPNEEISTLDGVLTRMEEGEDENERMLARAVRAVVDAVRTATTVVMDMLPLPASPLPWPGALRTDIYYTATDFPLRYQPPPGWVWSGTGVDTISAVDYKSAVSVNAVDTGRASGGRMVIDRKGRISWTNRGDDDMSSGIRWLIWTGERDGIPKGNLDFTGSSSPCPLDENGLVMPDEGLSGSRSLPLWNWQTESVRDRAIKRLRELRAQAETEIDYDPLTVELDEVETRCQTPELRVGDFINGFGRVLSVKQNGAQYDVECDRGKGEGPFIETRDDFIWVMRPIATVNGVPREDRPTALSLSTKTNNSVAVIDYDPLTVPVTRVSYDRVSVDQLRLGDNITGSGFGRLTGIKQGEGSRVRLVMNRDGRENSYDSLKDDRWDIEQIDVPNRDEIPTALSLSGIAVPAAVPAAF